MTVVCAARGDEVLDTLATVASKLLEESLRLGLQEVSTKYKSSQTTLCTSVSGLMVQCEETGHSRLRAPELPKKMWRSAETRVLPPTPRNKK